MTITQRTIITIINGKTISTNQFVFDSFSFDDVDEEEKDVCDEDDVIVEDEEDGCEDSDGWGEIQQFGPFILNSIKPSSR